MSMRGGMMVRFWGFGEDLERRGGRGGEEKI